MAYTTDSFDDTVIQLLKSGGVGFMPSDTVYGLSCLALSKDAVERVKQLKRRDSRKAFIVLISNVKMLDSMNIDQKQVMPAMPYWPGALTLECDTVKAPEWLPKIDGHFGVRLPGNQALRNLIDLTGPIISTSANLSGEAPAENSAEAKKLFGDLLDFYVDQGEIISVPSTLVRNSGGTLEVIRQGAVKIQ